MRRKRIAIEGSNKTQNALQRRATPIQSSSTEKGQVSLQQRSTTSDEIKMNQVNYQVLML